MTMRPKQIRQLNTPGVRGEGEDTMEEYPHLDNIPEARPRIMPVARGEGGDVL